MTFRLCFVLATLTIVGAGITNAEPRNIEDNAELTEIFTMDQADRRPGVDGIDASVVGKRDKVRQERTLYLLQQGQLRTSNDYLHAAFVFQHGPSVEDARLALSLAWVSATIDPQNERAKWLTAAAWDRLLMRQGVPQWYGTQFTREDKDNDWRLYDVQEGAVTDEQRKALGVRPLAKALELAKRMNDN